MERDFIADLLHHIFSREKKENPMPQAAQVHLFEKIVVALKHWGVSEPKKKEGE